GHRRGALGAAAARAGPGQAARLADAARRPHAPRDPGRTGHPPQGVAALPPEGVHPERPTMTPTFAPARPRRAVPSRAGDWAEAIKRSWAQGKPPDARAALDRDPALQGDKSVVLGLAYEEYCLRCEAGEQIDAEEYCGRFPAHRSSLRRMLATHDFFEG